MAPTTFHHFPLLPPELRDMIWKEAIRPNVPSAHFFTAWNPEANKSDEKYSTMVDHSVAGRGHKPGIPCGLAAPRCNQDDPDTPSWSNNNPSVYMEDSGLWTACWESRWVMLKRFGNHGVYYRKETRFRKLLKHPPESTDAPATGTLVQDGKVQYFTVCPKTDLFCLQPFHKNMVLRWPRFLSDVPIFNTNGSPRPHIALEFDPHWTDDDNVLGDAFKFNIPPLPRYETELSGGSRTDLGCVFLAATIQLSRGSDTLWFIDYRISRHSRAQPLDYDNGDLPVFQGRGCKYVEVRYNRYDPGWIMGHDKPTASIRRFMREFRQSLSRYLEANVLMASGLPGGFSISEWHKMPKLGVLARIPDN